MLRVLILVRKLALLSALARHKHHRRNTKQSKQLARLIRVNKDVYSGLCEQMKAMQGQPADYDRDLLLNTLCKAD